MKAIHNSADEFYPVKPVVSYLKDTQKWKQFTTAFKAFTATWMLCHISKILKNESNSQLVTGIACLPGSCVISQRYSKMKAIHNIKNLEWTDIEVVSYLKDTQKWKQFTTRLAVSASQTSLCHISKILKNESNSQLYSLSIRI